MGVPLADSANVSSTSVLSLSGATAGQFRLLGSWVSGHYKWVKVCGIVPSISAGGTATVTLTDGGAGNFGGANLATDNGATITVATGAATFTIKKANFNVIDSVVVGSSTVVASSTAATRGLILTGPNPTAQFPGNVTCPCTTVYSSANDPNSTAAIEENGPVMTVIRAAGNHVDGSGHPYMHYTARLYFYKGKTSVKVTTVLRNADYDTSMTPSPDAGGNTYDTAYKGIGAYELRISPAISGNLSYTIGTDSGSQSGTLSSSTDNAYIYQGQSQFMIAQTPAVCYYQSPGCANLYTTDTGYVVTKNGTALASGDSTKVIPGWADVSDVNGAGMEIGVYQMAAYWPKSLEFDNGGADVRVGIFPSMNSTPIYQAWPAWSIHDVFLNFHTSLPASLSGEFLKFQHYLVARPAIAYTNATGVFLYPIVDPAEEDNYYLNLANTASPPIGATRLCWNGAAPCTPDRDVGNSRTLGSAMNLGVYRQLAWSTSGPINQQEFRWSDMLKFLQRGFTGRFLNSAHFYRFLAEKGWPHADGVGPSDSFVNNFTWRSRPHWGATANPELDGLGEPALACGGDAGCSKITNSALSFVSWGSRDTDHFHWYGMPDYYFMTGDETIREAMTPLKDYYMNPDTYQGGKSGGLEITRDMGIALMGAARFAEFLQGTGDATSAGTALDTVGIATYNNGIKRVPCVSGYPAGCTPPSLNTASNSDVLGVSRERGIHIAQRSQGWCPAATGTNFYRSQEPFEVSILLEGLLSLRRAEGASWSDYDLASDLAYGMSQWSLTEGYNDDGTSSWQGANALYNGFRYLLWADFANVCPAGTAVVAGQTVQIGTNIYDDYSTATASQGMWQNFYLQYLTKGTTDWQRQFNTAIAQVAYHQSIWPADFGGYQIGALINAINHPSGNVLSDVPFTVTDAGSGNYTLSWTVPSGVRSYRIKWSPKTLAPIASLLNFDNLYTNSFGLSPNTYSTWFGANTVAEPVPAAAGQPQSLTINTGVTGLTPANFSVKAYAGGSPPPSTATNLTMFSGNGQTGTTGQPLPYPFVVKVTDANGNGVSGVAVTFAVTSGGGSLSATQALTNSLGQASTTLTLGTVAGSNTVTAASGNLAGSPVTFSATGVTGGAAANLVLVSGNNQSGTAGQPLANPFVVKVTDANANPVSGVAVTFSVTSGGGSLSATQVSTDSLGQASTTLTLGTVVGTNTATAASGSLAGSPILFTATGVAGTGPAANLVLVSGNNQSGTTGQPLASPFVVKVTDVNGNPVSGIAVTFTVTAGGGSLSATQVSTNNLGQASTTLTLGATAGTNTVTAASGTLAGSPITFTATGATPSPASITWTKQTRGTGWPTPNGYLSIDFDPVSQQTFFYVTRGQFNGSVSVTSGSTTVNWSSGDQFSTTWALAPGDTVTINGVSYTIASTQSTTQLTLTSGYGGSTGTVPYTANSTLIYSTDVYFYNSATGTFTHVGGNGTLTNASSNLVTDTATWPRDRHPVGQMAVDSKRNFLWLSQGVNGGTSINDLYYMTLNPDPMNNAWHQLTPSHYPMNQSVEQALIYDPDDDVLFQWGYDGGAGTHDHWIYCRTVDSTTPGTPTAKQLAAGCTRADDWNEVAPTNGIQPPGWSFPGLIYDTATKKVIQYGGANASGPQNQTWAYDIPTKTWTRKALSTTAPNINTDVNTPAQPAMTYIPAVHKILYHLSVGSGAPLDYVYDPVADTWTQLTYTGGGATAWAAMAYDAVNNKIITWNEGGTGDLWIGTPPAILMKNVCDLNGDGIVDVLDVQIAINQALGLAPCTNGDVNGDGVCNATDVQLVINAALGGS